MAAFDLFDWKFNTKGIMVGTTLKGSDCADSPTKDSLSVVSVAPQYWLARQAESPHLVNLN